MAVPAGSAAAVVVLGEPLTAQLVGAGVLMAIGVWLHLTEHHEHEHVHEAMEQPASNWIAWPASSESAHNRLHAWFKGRRRFINVQAHFDCNRRL